MNRPAEQAMGLVLAPRDEKYDEERAGCQTARRHRPTWWWAPPDPPMRRRR